MELIAASCLAVHARAGNVYVHIKSKPNLVLHVSDWSVLYGKSCSCCHYCSNNA